MRSMSSVSYVLISSGSSAADSSSTCRVSTQACGTGLLVPLLWAGLAAGLELSFRILAGLLMLRGGADLLLMAAE